MRYRPFKSFLGTPLNLPTGKAWYEEDIINAQRSFVKQFETDLLHNQLKLYKMKRNEIYDIIDTEREYQDANKDKADSHIVSDFPLSAGLLCIEKCLHDARNLWYNEKDPYKSAMIQVRKIAAIAVQMGEKYGMEERTAQ